MMKSMESSTEPPPSASYSLPVSGSLSRACTDVHHFRDAGSSVAGAPVVTSSFAGKARASGAALLWPSRPNL
jgi:hypothetical protein